MSTVFLSGFGPDRFGDVPKRVRFEMTEKMLRERGYDVWNPHSLMGQCTTPEAWARATFDALLNSDHIYMHAGWEAHPAAWTELHVAKACGIEILYEPVHTEGV